MRFNRRFSAGIIAACMLCTGAVPITAQADVIGAEAYFESVDRRQSLAAIEAALARTEVASQLRKLGVEPEEALARAEALSNHELQLLAGDLEELPAGGSLLGTIGVVFVVLLILELVGAIDLFNKI